MPNISINKTDLQDLGISLKDILLAITKSKNSNSDVIKIKKRKRKGRKNPRQPKPKQPKYSGFSGGGGGGGGGNDGFIQRQAPNITTVVTGSGSADNKDSQFNAIKDQQNYIKSQIEDFKRDNEIKMKAQQNQLAYYQDMNRLGMGVIYNKILENPLTKIQTSSFREPEPVDKTDRFGIIPTSDFYDSSIGSGRFEMIDEETPFQPPPDQIPEQTTDQTTTELDQMQDIPDLTTETVTPDQSNLKQEIFDTPPEDKPTPFEEALQKEVQKEEKRKAGRPKGSKNKPKEHPLTQQAIATDNELATRSSKSTLLNPEMATPDRFARQINKDSKNQETISKYFTPRKIVERKPVHLSLESVDENEPTLVPTPPPETKSSKLKSRLPMPSNRRSKSVDSALVFG